MSHLWKVRIKPPKKPTILIEIQGTGPQQQHKKKQQNYRQSQNQLTFDFNIRTLLAG